MAINTNGVTVSITQLTEDLDAQTIEVKDNKGNVVEVKPLNLVINETEATFVFKTALAADPTGVWTIAGKSFDADVAAKLAAINAGNTEIKLYNALTASGVKNLVVANSPTYFSADKPADGFKTIAEVQAFVDKVNADQTTDVEKAEQVKELFTALNSGSEVLALNALAPFENVNADFITQYVASLKTGGGKAIIATTPVKTVQGHINDINITEVGTLVTTAKSDAKRASYTKAVAAMKFVREDDAKVPTDKVKANLQKDLDLLNLVLNVKEASTAAQLANAYNALVAKVDNKTTIGTEVFYTDLRTKYMDATKVVTGAESVITVADIEAAIVKVNTQKRAELFNDVAKIVDAAGATQTSTADVLKKLQALAAYTDKAVFDIKTVETTESRLEAYRAAFVAATPLAVITTVTDFANTASVANVNIAIGKVKTKVDTANSTAVTAPLTKLENAANTAGGLFHDGTSAISTTPAKEAALLAELKNSELALGNVVDANAAAYLVDLASIQAAATVGGGTTADAIKALKVAVNDINLLVDINKATTAAEVSTALLALSGNNDYINVPSADRLWVATKVLDARNAVVSTKKFADLDAVMHSTTGKLKLAATAHGTALDAVNDLTIASPLAGASSVIAALSLVDADFAKLSSSEQSAIAEPFFLGLKFAEASPGKVTPAFRTLADVKTAAGL